MVQPIRPLRFAAAAAVAGLLAMSPAPAFAQDSATAAAASLAWAKTEAILGGAPSALQAILAQQAASHKQSYLSPSSAPVEPSAPLQPRLVPAVLRQPSISPGVLSGRPDIFGSVALRVGATPLTARWRRVERAGIAGAPERYAEELQGLPQVERLEAVNRYVNRRVTFEDDQRQYGRPDVWSSANDTLRRGRGDCEDYAIAKFQMLRRAGIADRDLYLVVLRDLVRRADHAVLVVRSAGHMFLLDNGTDELIDSDSVGDYRPVLTFAASGTWTHGYRVQPAASEIASLGIGAPAAIPGAGDQRSRSASLLAFNTGFSR